MTLLTGEDPVRTPEQDVAEARRELDAALEALRRARAAWTAQEGGDMETVRRALDAAERQLDQARVRLQRALDRRAGR